MFILKIECKYGMYCQRPNCSYTHPHNSMSMGGAFFPPFPPHGYPMMNPGFYPKKFKKVQNFKVFFSILFKLQIITKSKNPKKRIMKRAKSKKEDKIFKLHKELEH